MLKLTDFELTTEQSFKLESLKRDVLLANTAELQLMLIEFIRQSMVKDNIIKSLIKNK